MADLGLRLISKIINDSDIVTAVTGGLRPEWFEDETHREVYQWMLSFYGKYGQAPNAVALGTQFPNYVLKETPEPYDFYIDHFREQRKRALLSDMVVSANTALNDGDTKRAQEHVSQGLLNLGREVTTLTDQNAVEDMADRYKVYKEAQRNQGTVTGIATGFPTLDFSTSGYHPQQFIVLGGMAKQGKSFILMKMAIAAQEQGKRVLFLSFEMSGYEQLARYDALCFGINSMRLLHGTTTDEDFDKLKAGMRTRKNMAPFIISADISATTTVSGLSGKIEQHQPDIVFIDGVYLMENEVGAEPGSSQAYTSISRNLKRLAQRIKMPLVVTTQALSSKMKDNKVSMHSLGWTSAWSQDADLILGVERRDTDPTINLRIVAGRNVSPREIQVRVDWENSEFEELEEDDYDGD